MVHNGKKGRGETFLQEISLLTWVCGKEFASTGAWLTGSLSLTWELVRNSNSWAPPRPRDAEILRVGPTGGANWSLRLPSMGREKEFLGTRYSRVNNHGWWISICPESWLSSCQRLVGGKGEQWHSSNNQKHPWAHPGGIPARGKHGV